MYQKDKPLQFTTVFANVPDVDAVLSQLYTKLGLRAFLRFELDASDRVTPIALVKLGEHTLELLGRVAGERPQNGVIQCVEFEAPVQQMVELEPSPGMKIRCYPGEQQGIRSVEVLTPMLKEDIAVFIDYTGATMENPDSPLLLEGGCIRFIEAEGFPVNQMPGLFFPGWHRLGVQVASVAETYDMMTASGSSLAGLVEPFQVMPGLKEAMLVSPSGLILQITEESLLKMTPSIALEWVRAKFSGHAMRFKAGA